MCRDLHVLVFMSFREEMDAGQSGQSRQCGSLFSLWMDCT